MKTLLTSLAFAAALNVNAQTPTAIPTSIITHALIAQDHVALRSSPKDSANSQAMLWQGELVEVRAERMEYAQVWDYKRERGGYVRMNQLRKVSFSQADADSLLSILNFVKDAPGSEGLTFGYGAAWLKAVSAAQMSSATGAQVLEAIGTAADRLARRASMSNLPKTAQEATAAQLDAAKRYGIKFESYEHEGKVTICYEGELFSRIMAMQNASAAAQAHAALGLTRSECEDPNLALKNPSEARKNQEWRAALLQKVDAAQLPATLKNRLHIRRASVWAQLAYQRKRMQQLGAANSDASNSGDSQLAAQLSLNELGAVNKEQLTDDDWSIFNDAVMRVNASRWAAAPLNTAQTASSGLKINLHRSDQAGETCVSFDQSKEQIAKRCTYGIVWLASFSVNREATAAALAVQTQAGWREMWLLRKQGGAWVLDVLPPSSSNPDSGYIEFAGWTPNTANGNQILLARESRSEGKYKRSYEVMNLSNLSIERQSNDASQLGAFQRWQSPTWKQQTVSLR